MRYGYGGWREDEKKREERRSEEEVEDKDGWKLWRSSGAVGDTPNTNTIR